MPNIKIEGLEELDRLINSIQENKDEIIGVAVYAGSSVIADEMNRQIQNIKVDERWGTPEEPVEGIKAAAKQGLIEGFGISKMENDRGFYNVKIGFEGYNGIKSSKWPKGQPNVMIARSLEKGTSFLKKDPFMKRTINRTKRASIQAAQEAVDEKIRELQRRV